MALSLERLGEFNFRMERVNADRDTRVKVYTLGGTQIGFRDVGTEDNPLTFPRRYIVRDALRRQDWVRFATAEEKKQKDCWWVIAEVQPASIIYDDGSVAPEDLPIGFRSERVSALSQAEGLRPQAHCEVKPNKDVSEVSTPPTPPPFP